MVQFVHNSKIFEKLKTKNRYISKTAKTTTHENGQQN